MTGRRADLVERDAHFILRYRAGETLQQIGASYGVTRELVRQRLAALGLRARSGGAAVRSQFRRARHEAKLQAQREARVLAAYGVSVARFNEITGGAARARKRSPVAMAYMHGKKNAHRYGLEWALTMDAWWTLWQESGKWAQRARGDGYWLARIDSNRGFVPGNVRIVTGTVRSSDSYLQKPAAMRVAKRMKGAIHASF